MPFKMQRRSHGLIIGIFRAGMHAANPDEPMAVSPLHRAFHHLFSHDLEALSNVIPLETTGNEERVLYYKTHGTLYDAPPDDEFVFDAEAAATARADASRVDVDDEPLLDDDPYLDQLSAFIERNAMDAIDSYPRCASRAHHSKRALALLLAPGECPHGELEGAQWRRTRVDDVCVCHSNLFLVIFLLFLVFSLSPLT